VTTTSRACQERASPVTFSLVTAPLVLRRNTDLDWLSAYEFGVVEDGQPECNWHVISAHCRLLFDRPGGRLLGFDLGEFSALEPELLEAEGLFDTPRFDVPTLGLRRATVGEVSLAARAHLGDEPTVDQAFFQSAVSAGEAGDLAKAEYWWRLCLEAGALEAHYGLGYTLLDRDRPREAYGHLRYYTETTPANPWAWCYRGRAAEALGERTEARRCYERAVALERSDWNTDAASRLEGLDSLDAET